MGQVFPCNKVDGHLFVSDSWYFQYEVAIQPLDEVQCEAPEKHELESLRGSECIVIILDTALEADPWIQRGFFG
jgi:hypothetical protein